VALYRRQFDEKEAEASALMAAGLIYPGYDAVIKCSHIFNVLEARGAISVTERTGFIARVRNLARAAAAGYVKSREDLGFPLLKENEAE
jgi:glycyl-tRNA synthetase alpha chain